LSGGVIVISAYTQLQRSNDAAFTFEQEANFWWLTGIDVANWRLIVDGGTKKSWLVAPAVSDIHQMFDGSLSADEAMRCSGVEGVLTAGQADEKLRTLAKQHKIVYSLGDDPHAGYCDFVQNPAPKELWQQLNRLFVEVRDCRKDIAELRAIKQPQEIAAMKKAIKLTTDSFNAVRAQLDTFQYEYEVEAEFSYLFRRAGAKGHAYDPIVAAGGNACTLHYTANDSRLKKRQLLLLDVGARVDGYAADITRTYALGEPTKRQQAVHEAVAEAERRCIALLQPGLSVAEYHKSVDDIMIEALLSLGLMARADDSDNYHKYFPHAISHGLGVDVHDSLGAPVFLQPGMVLTVEPGIYIPEEGIGVRIEDNILITDSGHLNLSAALSTDYV
jgi:Xaa-Pro aminopeptidase